MIYFYEMPLLRAKSVTSDAASLSGLILAYQHTLYKCHVLQCQLEDLLHVGLWRDLDAGKH